MMRLVLLLLAFTPIAISHDAIDHYEVVVVSGSSGGFGAALAAGRMGAKVALIEDTPVLGGILSNGVSNIDTESYESLSGIFEEFRQRVRRYYEPLMATDPIFRGSPRSARHMSGRGRQSNDPREGGRWEPHVANRICKTMLDETPNVQVFYNTWATDVIMRENRVAGVVTENSSGERRRFLGDVVIDATHEGDIAAWAGAPYRVGREARSRLEPHAGEILFFNGTGEILEGSTGRQDRAIVSYGLRLTIKIYDNPNHILKSPPPGYHKAEYALAPDLSGASMPNGKLEMNVNPVGSEMQEVNWTWPEATRAERLKLYHLYKNHALGYLYYLQHERGMTQLGLPDDEFTDNGNVPYRVFVREARRIVGEATMTEADVNPFLAGHGLTPPLRRDSIAVGHYPIDSKAVKAKRDTSTPDKSQGDFFLVNACSAFQVPYGAIVPKGIDGLLAPVAMSATHVAFSAIRMDPTWMSMGQAAGVAAVLSLRDKVEVRHVNVERLQRELLRQKCRLAFYWDLPLDHPAYSAVQWLTLHGGVTGYPDRLFRPDQPLTRAELAALVVNGFDLWPSVSDAHFSDVPYTTRAFRDIETLFDKRLLEPFGVRPRWPEAGSYDPQRHAGFNAAQNRSEFAPERPVLWQELAGVLRLLRPAAEEDVAAWLNAVLRGSEFGRRIAERGVTMNAAVTRGEACALVAALIWR